MSNKAGVYKLTSDTLNAVASFPTFFFPKVFKPKESPGILSTFSKFQVATRVATEGHV